MRGTRTIKTLRTPRRTTTGRTRAKKLKGRRRMTGASRPKSVHASCGGQIARIGRRPVHSLVGMRQPGELTVTFVRMASGLRDIASRGSVSRRGADDPTFVEASGTVNT